MTFRAESGCSGGGPSLSPVMLALHDGWGPRSIASGQTVRLRVSVESERPGASLPAWETLHRPSSDAAKADLLHGPSFQGKPTRVFAWLGVPELKAGKKHPGWCWSMAAAGPRLTNGCDSG